MEKNILWLPKSLTYATCFRLLVCNVLCLILLVLNKTLVFLLFGSLKLVMCDTHDVGFEP